MKPSNKKIINFKKDWGQSHTEICANLGYSIKGSDDLLMLDYFYLKISDQWYPKCSSLYTTSEQEIADYLRLN